MSIRAASIALALSLLFITLFARTTPPIITAGDIAVTELYTELASEGRLLVGPYSRFGWHHPGPAYFFVQAIPYVLGGRAAASLYATALTLNLAALAVICAALMRERRGVLLVLIPAACLLLAWRAPRFLASPWTAHVPILLSVAFVVVGAQVLAGRARLLPLMLAVGSFVVQTHLAFGPMVALLSAAAVASVLSDRGAGRERWSIAAAAAVVLGVLSLPVAVELLARRGGNVAALWEFFVSRAGEGHSYREALLAWSYGIAGVLRSDFDLPWGGHFAVQGAGWTMACAAAQVLALSAIAWAEFRRGRRFEAWLALLALAVSAIGLWSLTRVRDDILDHEIFPIAAWGALNLAIIAAALLRWVSGEWASAGPLAPRTTAVLLAALALGAAHLQDLTAFERRRTERPSVIASYEAIRDYLARENVRRPLVEMEGATWSHTAGVILRLRQADLSCAVREEAIPMFTDAFAANGSEDALISIGTRARHVDLAARPGNVVLRDRDPAYIDVIKVAPGRLR